MNIYLARILPIRSQSDYVYHWRWPWFASCHYIHVSDKLHASYLTASYRAQLNPSKTRKQLRTSKLFAFAAEMENRASLQPLSRVKAVYIYSRIRIYYFIPSEEAQSQVFWFTTQYLSYSQISIANTVWESKPKMENKMKSVYLSGKLVHVTWLPHLGKGGKPIMLCLDPKSALPPNSSLIWYLLNLRIPYPQPKHYSS